jgi:hypothetical protein
VSSWVIVPSQSKIQWIGGMRDGCLVDMMNFGSCPEEGVLRGIVWNLEMELVLNVRRSKRDIEHIKVCLVVICCCVAFMVCDFVYEVIETVALPTPNTRDAPYHVGLFKTTPWGEGTRVDGWLHRARRSETLRAKSRITKSESVRNHSGEVSEMFVADVDVVDDDAVADRGTRSRVAPIMSMTSGGM